MVDKNGSGAEVISIRNDSAHRPCTTRIKGHTILRLFDTSLIFAPPAGAAVVPAPHGHGSTGKSKQNGGRKDVRCATQSEASVEPG